MIKDATDNNIDDILKSGRTFIIVFYDNSMPNTDNVFKIFEEFDSQFQGKIDMYKCEIMKNRGKMVKYFNMNSLPAMVMMKNNKPYANVVGPVSAMSYQNAIAKGIMDIMNDNP